MTRLNEVDNPHAGDIAFMQEERDRLAQHPKIAPLLKAVGKWVEKTQSRSLTLDEKRTISRCMYNAIENDQYNRRKARTLNEATTEDSIQFLGGVASGHSSSASYTGY